MQHITRTAQVQIKKRVEAGEDMADVAHAFNITIERVEGLSGVKRKANKKANATVKGKAADAVDPAAEFE